MYSPIIRVTHLTFIAVLGIALIDVLLHVAKVNWLLEVVQQQCLGFNVSGDGG